MRIAGTATAFVLCCTLAVASMGSAAAGTGGLSRPSAAPASDRADVVTVPADTRITFYLGLKRDSAALHRAARDASTPDRAQYRHFMSLADAGTTYGASAATVASLRATAKRLGMTVRVDRTGLFARATAKASVWSAMYDRPVLATEVSPGVVIAFIPGRPGATARYDVPRQLAGSVQEVLRSSTFMVPTRATRDGLVPGPPPLPSNDSPPGQTCVPAAEQARIYSPSQLHTAYGTTALQESGLVGRGARMTVLSLGEPFWQDELDAAAKCFGYRAPRVTVTPADGVTGRLPVVSLSGETETLLDLQTVAPVLTGASSIRLVETNTPASIVEAMVNGMSTALDMDGAGTMSPDVISVSYGECVSAAAALNEQFGGAAGDFGLAEDVLAMAGIVGTSVFIASQDLGSSTCVRLEGSGAGGQEVSWPASSSWVTSVGGSFITLTQDNRRSAEIPWNDTPWLGPNMGGGGGGPALQPAPWYQPRTTPNDVRVVPDLVAHASNIIGWPVVQGEYVNGTPTFGVIAVGGTSASTPFIAANIALIAARERERGRPPLGLINPWLYDLGSRGQGFYDITTGNNQINAMAACCVATRGFDQATGLGAPRFPAIAHRVPPVGR